MRDTIKIAIAGIGNCASSLIQGIVYYRKKNPQEQIGLMHWDMAGYEPGDIRVVAAFDIDKRKINKDVAEAIFEKPNCTRVFCSDIPATGTIVEMGRVEDGYASHMDDYDEQYRFIVSDALQPDKEDVVKRLKESGAQMLLNYMPVGSEKAAKFYAECCLEANIGFINNMPVFLASDPVWSERFKEKNIPIIGDDIKSQLGATIIHRTLTNLFRQRGVKLERTYQINTGGNTDFLNMLDRKRLASKKISKTQAVQSQLGDNPLDEVNIHVGPSDYVPWQKDNKVCFIRMEGKLFGDSPMEIEMRLSVEDSPDSAGVVIDAVRCMKIALDRGMGGVIHPPSSYFMKHPPIQYTDEKAWEILEAFISDSKGKIQ
jgi:myo-inositol-1-phosphate synthase